MTLRRLERKISIAFLYMDRPKEEGGMEETALSEAWDWLDEELKLDSESPLVVSQSLWDDFTHSNESVVRSLFACTPPSHAKEAVSCASSLGEQDSPQTSSNWHIASSPLENQGMLQFHADENTNTNSRLSESFENCSGPFIKVCDDFQAKGPSSPSSMWFNEESFSSAPDNTVEQSAESWIAGCFDDSNAGDFQEVAHYHGSPINARVPKISPARAPAMTWKNRQVRRWVRAPREVLGSPQQGAKTMPFANSRGKQSSRPAAAHGFSKLQPVKGSLRPVVYPFTLVKPCGIQGDATLKDINQRINIASPSKTLSEPSNKAPPSCTSSPFLGKSVLAVTKIHTEGKGTITIMRTRI